MPLVTTIAMTAVATSLIGGNRRSYTLSGVPFSLWAFIRSPAAS
jgi:hypothetical protein